MSSGRVKNMLTTLLGIFSIGTRSGQGLNTTLTALDPRNGLGVDADPIVLYHDTLGQILILLPTPAPDWLPGDFFERNHVVAYDLAESGIIPKYFYARDNVYSNWYRT